MKNTNLVYGKISSGKTTGFMFNNIEKIIDNNENFIVVDNKEEYYNNFMDDLIEKGYNTYLINLRNTIKSNGFNVLLLPYKLYKQGDIDESIRMVRNIALEIFKSDKAQDTFWQDSASDYFVGLSLMLFKNAKEDEINIGSIVSIITKIEESDEILNRIREKLNNLDLLDPIYINMHGTIFSPKDTRGGIISVALASLNKYISIGNLLNLLCSNDINLYNLSEKTAIFIIGTSDNNRLTNIVLNELIRLSEMKKISFNYILDNFDSQPKLLELDNLLDNAKRLNQVVYIIIRNVERLKDIYGEFITDKFEDIIGIKEENYKEIKFRNYNEYPKLNTKENKYYNLEEYLNYSE